MKVWRKKCARTVATSHANLTFYTFSSFILFSSLFFFHNIFTFRRENPEKTCDEKREKKYSKPLSAAILLLMGARAGYRTREYELMHDRSKNWTFYSHRKMRLESSGRRRQQEKRRSHSPSARCAFAKALALQADDATTLSKAAAAPSDTKRSHRHPKHYGLNPLLATVSQAIFLNQPANYCSNLSYKAYWPISWKNVKFISLSLKLQVVFVEMKWFAKPMSYTRHFSKLRF